MNDCLDIGLIQAFLDGELNHAETSRVSSHIASCDDCAVLLARAEDESALVFPALEREFNTLVPTQRLWSRINDSIEAERAGRPFLQKTWAFVRVSLLSPSFAGAAGLLIVTAIFAWVWMGRTTSPSDDVASVSRSNPQPSVASVSLPNAVPAEPASEPRARTKVYVERAAYRVEQARPIAKSLGKPVDAIATSTGYMPGEESYVKTISSLGKTVDDKKDMILRPSQRVSFERDMALVNDSIAKMKKEVKRNPKNESARQVLYSSYQNKIDLLNSVAQKEELMVSIR